MYMCRTSESVYAYMYISHVQVPNLHVSLKEHLPEREFDEMEARRSLVDGLIVTCVLVMRLNDYIIEVISERRRERGERKRERERERE